MNNRLYRASLLSLALCSALFGSPVQAAESSVSHTYNNMGFVETINGPRPDVNDVTTYGYDAQGHRTSVTNALGQVTSLSSFDPLGNPQSFIAQRRSHHADLHPAGLA